MTENVYVQQEVNRINLVKKSTCQFTRICQSSISLISEPVNRLYL